MFDSLQVCLEQVLCSCKDMGQNQSETLCSTRFEHMHGAYVEAVKQKTQGLQGSHMRNTFDNTGFLLPMAEG